MADCWQEIIRENLWDNIWNRAELSDQQKVDLLEVEYAKAIAETESFTGLGFITDDGTLWQIQRSQTLSPEQKYAALAEEATRLVVAKMAEAPELTAAQKWALQEGLNDAF
jgi:hypothetical protein